MQEVVITIYLWKWNLYWGNKGVEKMFDRERIGHDVACAEMVGEIYKLGGFKQQFPVYVTCYADKGELYYYVCNNSLHVYDFINKKLQEELYCIPPVRKSMTCIVVAGQFEVLYQKFKVTAAKELMEEGAGEVARLLPRLAPKQTNEAQDLMEQLRVGLKGVFHAEKRQLYRGLLDMAYYAKKINGAYYTRTMEWLDAEEMRLEEERIVHAVHERVYCGFAYYKPDGSIGYYTNAVQESTIMRREEMMIAGIVVSPILIKRYCFNDISDIGNAIAEFKELLKVNIDANFMKLVDFIYEAQNISDTLLDAELVHAENELLEKTLKYYKSLWQI